MKVIFLTTETLHHAFFIKQLSNLNSHAFLTIIEQEAVKPPFVVEHDFEIEREKFELDSFFNGNEKRISDFSETFEVRSINDNEVVELIHQFNPDIVLDFGTRKVSSNIIKLMGDNILNLHGGHPEFYRGLDSHLWAIYNGRFDLLVATLHQMKDGLDVGQIIIQEQVTLNDGMKISELRAATTRSCVRLVKTALYMKEEFGFFLKRPQCIQGTYFSFMPCELKSICVSRFNKFTNF